MLGDTYDELIESLSRLADAGLTLHIGAREKTGPAKIKPAGRAGPPPTLARIFPLGVFGGNFQPQRRVQFFQIQFCRKEVHDSHTQNLGQKQQLAIWRAPELCFQFGDGFAADIPALDLQSGRERLLRQILAAAEFPHLGAD